VADHGDGLALLSLQAGGNGHAQRGADRGAGVAVAEGVVLAFAAARESGQAVLLAQAGHALATAGEDLVRVGLVADIPDQAIVRRIENVMQRDGQLDDAEPGAEVPAGLADAEQQFLAQFVGELFEFRLAQATQLRGRGGAVKNGRLGAKPRDLMERLEHRANRFYLKKEPQFTRWARR